MSEFFNKALFLDPRFMDEYIPTDTEVAIAKDRLAREGAELVEIDIPSPASDMSTEQQNTENEPPSK